MPKADVVKRINQRWNDRAAGGIVMGISDSASVSLSAGADIRVSGYTIARKGNKVLLFNGALAVVREYAPDATGLAAAIAAAASGDIIQIPAGTIDASITIPAGVALVGRGWNSVIEGMITLGDGASAAHLRVYQSVNSGADIIGVIGPASGEALVRDVQVSLTQAGGGNALGLLSNGGTLRAFECEVRVNGGTGSSWAAAAVTDGIVELNQGLVKAERAS